VFCKFFTSCFVILQIADCEIWLTLPTLAVSRCDVSYWTFLTVTEQCQLVEITCVCVCVVGWLRPLVNRVTENGTVVAVPVMDIIDDSTFEYKSFDTQSINIGGFDWSLQFTWIGISDREKRRRVSDFVPVRCQHC